MLRRQLMIAVATCAILIGGAVGCSFDIEPGSQLAGQKCNSDDDCAEGLVCSERICRATAGESPWSSGPDAGEPDGGQPDSDHPPPPNVGTQCEPGERRCNSEDVYAVCETDPRHPDSQPGWQSYHCADDEICAQGRCVDRCDEGQQFDPDTGECISVTEPCCAGGCADDEICHDCSCVSYNPNICEYQDQPCDSPGELMGRFYCIDYDGLTQPRCMGICDPQAPDPNATCPGPHSYCAFEDDNAFEGICMTSCAIDDPCADDNMSCIYIDGTPGDGVCYPSTGTGEVGDLCDPQDPFSCAGEALCIEGTCMQSCRPFEQSETDCNDGYCAPFDANMGVCIEDASDGQGGCMMEGGTCGEDATGCYPSDEPGTQLQCYEFCRLEEETKDCSDDDHACHRFDQQNEVLGFCGPAFATQ